MKKFRNILFQVHLWTGLAAGIVFVLLGLSGSALVYPSLWNALGTDEPKATIEGPELPLETIIAAARQNSPQDGRRAATVTFPAGATDVYRVQFNARTGGRGARDGEGQNAGRGDRAGGGRGGRRGAQQIAVDPVSGAILQTASTAPSPLFGMAHQLHESMLLPGALGRSIVGWAGVGMLFLGLSGLYLWWPKAGQWKYAFGVRRSARGARLYREIHGMFGIWFWIVFLFVTITGLPLSFPGLMSTITAQPAGPPQTLAQSATIDVAAGASVLPLADIVKAVEQSSHAKASGITVPVQPDRAVTVTLAGDGRPQTVSINPYTGAILSSPQRQSAGFNRGLIEQLHGGAMLGPVWKFLVFLTGFLPLIFVTTGLLMWIKKRQSRGARHPVQSRSALEDA